MTELLKYFDLSVQHAIVFLLNICGLLGLLPFSWNLGEVHFFTELKELNQAEKWYMVLKCRGTGGGVCAWSCRVWEQSENLENVFKRTETWNTLIYLLFEILTDISSIPNFYMWRTFDVSNFYNGAKTSLLRTILSKNFYILKWKNVSILYLRGKWLSFFLSDLTMLPLSLLRTAQNHPMLVELKNGETYNGHLVSCDNWMNINLREVSNWS